MKHICRICLNKIPALNFIACKKDESSQIKMQLSMCVPEMIVDLVKDPVYCKSCVSALQFAYNFKTRCLRTEEHIHNYSVKMLSSKSIDIQDILYDLQLSTTNGEDENARKEGFTVTPTMNFLLLDEDVTAAGYKINNANNITANGFSKSAIETTADELKRLLDGPLGITPIQSLEFKQEAENENEEITIKEEDIAVQKVESPSYEGFEDDVFEDANSVDHTADVKSMDNKNAILQSNIVAQNCFVKLTKLPDDIQSKNNILLDDALQNTPNHALVSINQVENVNRDIKIEEDNTTKHKRVVKSQLRIHTGEKPFACSVCAFRSARKYNLKKHQRIHTGEKPFSCNVCARRFAQKSHLQDHLRVHTGEKPFACNMCNLRFSQKSSVQQHLRVHTGEKPFACNVCTYRSADKARLRDHLRIHTGEKPFACSMCTIRFARKYNLLKHLRIHTSKKSFACM